MRTSLRTTMAAAVTAGVVMALAMTAGSASAAAPVTIGSTAGTPGANIPNCTVGTLCTYYSNSSGSTPAAQVPSDGTITSFSVNAGSAGGTVFLRVLRPAGNGQFTGAGTSPAETLAVGLNTFSVSLPVKAGDVLGIDNANQALIFDDTVGSTPYWMPALSDGSTTGPTATTAPDKLLMSAVEQPNDTTTTPTNPTTPTTPSGPISSTNPISVATPASNTKPSLSSVSQSHRAWLEGSKFATLAAARKPPKPSVGTTFKFTLAAPAKVTLTFRRKVKGKMKNVGQLVFVGHAGVNRVSFQGVLTPTKRLSPGRYTVVFGAINTAGSAQSVSRKFTILP